MTSNGGQTSATVGNGAETNGTPSSSAADLYTVPLWIDGQEIHTDASFPITSPHTHAPIGLASGANIPTAHRAITAASAAFPAWSRTRPRERRDLFLRAADILDRRGEELGAYMEAETGASPGWAGGFNVPMSSELLRDVAGRISGVMGWVPTCAEEGVGAVVWKEPFGVVLGIAPWNAPLFLGLRAIIFALATGNTVILKGSELSPRTTWALGSILHEAGLPPGVLNVIHHRPGDAAAVTEALIAHPDVKKINFTGSTAVGRVVAGTAGRYLKPVLMELGGKASCVVLEDADLEEAVRWCAVGAFLNAGQICMSTERILVHASVAPEFTRLLTSHLATIYPPTAPAHPVVTPHALRKTTTLIASALSQGAHLLSGTGVPLTPTTLTPCLLTSVTPNMSIYRAETFGPCVSLLTVSDDEEAIRVANDTEYGLSAAVFTRDLARGLRMARGIESGAVHVNGMTVHDECVLPHGGVKGSGYGRFGGNWGLDEFLRLKTVTFRE